MLMLIDSGSSHSFLDQSFANSLGCRQTTIPARAVKLANGDLIPCNSEIKDFTWWIPNSTFQHNMKVLPLGIDWLVTWGVMKCEFAEKWMEFQYEGATIRLQVSLTITKMHLMKYL